MSEVKSKGKLSKPLERERVGAIDAYWEKEELGHKQRGRTSKLRATFGSPAEVQASGSNRSEVSVYNCLAMLNLQAAFATDRNIVGNYSKVATSTLFRFSILIALSAN